MRIRQVKPEFWRDELVASQTDAVRLFYIGLWQCADDGGWLNWSVPEIGHDLYGYEPRTRRERWVQERGEALAAIGRLHFHGCGHAFLPTLTKHQKFGGRPVYTVRDAHARDCAPLRADAPHGKERNGKEMVGEGMGGEILIEDDDIRSNRAIANDESQPETVRRAARKYLMGRGVAA